MKKKIITALFALALPTIGLSASAIEYPFPTEMKVTIERGETPILKSKSSVVYPIVNMFSVNLPNGSSEFVLQDQTGNELQMVKDGEDHLLQSSIGIDDQVFFGPDTQTATKPIRVMLQGPISLGHIHFNSGSTALSEEARFILGEMATQMLNSGLFAAYLTGMTDRAGSEESNLALSLKRANVAAKYLAKKLSQLGVEEPFITVENMGEHLASASGPLNPYDRKVTVLVYPKV